MSQESAETVRPLFDAAARREESALAAVWDPDVVMTFSASPFDDFHPH